MPIYLVSGKLGSGKTLACVGQIREAIWSGRRVATNLDLNLDKLLGPRNKKARVVRIPDKPTVEDLELLGCGNDEMDETKNGVIILDELAAWLNARSFNDKARQPVLDWLIHSRKKGWDVYFICQNIQQIDKQVRESLVEYLVSCRRLDRIKIPFVGKLLNSLTAGYISGNLPKVHIGVIKYGTEQHAPIADRWVYMARDLYAAYDTRQIFTDERGTERFIPGYIEEVKKPTRKLLPSANPKTSVGDYESEWIEVPARIEGRASGTFTYLPPWYFQGFRQKTLRQKVADWIESRQPQRPPLKPKHPLADRLRLLPPAEAVRHFQRLEALGYWDKAAA